MSSRELCELLNSLSKNQVSRLTEDVRVAVEHFEKEPTLLRLKGSFILVGDIHGNLESLLTIFISRGFPDTQKYLFLGDYVDRGEHSVEVVYMLYTLKALYPENIYLIRGNHEEDRICSRYGFLEEAIDKDQEDFYRFVVSSFEYLPLAAIVNETILCVHGGITNHASTIDDIASIERPVSLHPSNEAAYELTWNDPSCYVTDYVYNHTRKAGKLFGASQLQEFLQLNKLRYIVRAHQDCHEGYNFPFGKEIPLVTIFSSEGYCGQKNRGAIGVAKETGSLSVVTFSGPTDTHVLLHPRHVLHFMKESSPLQEGAHQIVCY